MHRLKSKSKDRRSELRPGPSRIGLEGRFTYRSRLRRASGLFPDGERDLIPIYFFDLSSALDLGKLRLTLKANNLLNYHYAEVERNLGPPRRLSLGLSGEL